MGQTLANVGTPAWLEMRLGSAHSLKEILGSRAIYEDKGDSILPRHSRYQSRILEMTRENRLEILIQEAAYVMEQQAEGLTDVPPLPHTLAFTAMCSVRKMGGPFYYVLTN